MNIDGGVGLSIRPLIYQRIRPSPQPLKELDVDGRPVDWLAAAVLAHHHLGDSHPCRMHASTWAAAEEIAAASCRIEQVGDVGTAQPSSACPLILLPSTGSRATHTTLTHR